MSDIHTSTLYRIHRPTSFNDVVGQDHIVSALSHALKNNTLPHALIFSGSRGLGKTSIARILAQEIGTSQIDTIEIDAASNRGIDDIRSLKEEVQVLPRESQKKVYIIDEVHMLTREAFNALLKTLEEPPSHILFILATTELHKVPATIISRCQVHEFIKPTLSLLQEYIVRIAEREKRTILPDAVLIIAQQGKGSYRDTLSALQKVLDTIDSDVIKKSDLENIFRTAPLDICLDLLESFSLHDIHGIYTHLSRISESIESDTVYSTLVSLIRTLILLRVLPEQSQQLLEHYEKHAIEKIIHLSKESVKDIHSHFLLSLLEHGRIIRSSQEGFIVLETLFLKQLEKNNIS